MTLPSAARFRCCVVVWLLAFSCSVLRTVLWLVEQKEMLFCHWLCSGVNLLFIVLFSAPELFVLELSG